MKKISLLEVKQALRDDRFRKSLPEEFAQDIQKYLNNPGCACNVPIYRRILKDAVTQLKAYYPNREVIILEEEVEKLAQNNFSVINCKCEELETKLKALSVGRKQIAIARYEGECTVIVNDLDLIF